MYIHAIITRYVNSTKRSRDTISITLKYAHTVTPNKLSTTDIINDSSYKSTRTKNLNLLVNTTLSEFKSFSQNCWTKDSILAIASGILHTLNMEYQYFKQHWFQIFKGVFKLRSQLPKFLFIWDVQVCVINNLGKTCNYQISICYKTF